LESRQLESGQLESGQLESRCSVLGVGWDTGYVHWVERQRISSGLPYELIVGYSRAVRVDNQVFVSGTAPVNADGSCAPDVASQLRRCFEIIEKALMEAGGGLADVTRTRIFLTDRSDAHVVEKVHGELFTDIRPANTMLIVSGLMNPQWKIEVEVDAMIGTRDRERLQS
jgi:enamine deaminase RidA (YjgF/YER057c/UK114 family)